MTAAPLGDTAIPDPIPDRIPGLAAAVEIRLDLWVSLREVPQPGASGGDVIADGRPV